jgi:glycyl-tRNA synthetase beta chain
MKILQKTFEQLPGENLKSDTTEKVYAFVLDRLKVLLRESGIRHEAVNIAVTDKCDILKIYRRAETLDNFMKNESGEKLLSMHKRVKNIIQSNDDVFVDVALLKEKEEIDLSRKIKELEKKLMETAELQEQLTACTKMEHQLFDFFDKILVNANDKRIKQNRLNLLTKLAFVFDGVISS